MRTRGFLVVGLALLLLPASAGAAVTPSRDANAVAGAMDSFGGAGFTVIPPAPSRPAGFSGSLQAGFPTRGSNYALLSTGDAVAADTPNSAGNTSTNNGGGPGPHGTSVYDLVQIKVNFNVPKGANCAGFDFRFLSEEYPEFVGSRFNDGFIAELDTSDFNVAATGITAPHNFAFDDSGHVISVNTTGFSAPNAAGTTYDGGTPLLHASTPVSPGAHSIYLSVFDQSDPTFDSAAILDNVHAFSAAGGCHTGATSVGAPVAGKSFDAEPVSGKVYFKCRGDHGRTRLSQAVNLPVGKRCTVDARAGKLRVVSAANGSSTNTKASVFFDGQFQIREKKAKKPLTEARLVGKLAGCGHTSTAASGKVQDAKRKKRRGRRLWGKGKGRFRTRGRHSTATVRGTTWLVYDRCDGSTYNKVTKGVVTVHDLVRHKNIRLRNKKGHRVYIARPRRHRR
jgi:hypothetical protein